jgi:hypothetical protein
MIRDSEPRDLGFTQETDLLADARDAHQTDASRPRGRTAAGLELTYSNTMRVPSLITLA